jgi:hypothetical protein
MYDAIRKQKRLIFYKCRLCPLRAIYGPFCAIFKVCSPLSLPAARWETGTALNLQENCHGGLSHLQTAKRFDEFNFSLQCLCNVVN